MADGEHSYLRLAVDLAILTVRDDELQALVITRGDPPFRGRHALPGGFLRDDEDLPSAAVRELREQTSLDGAGLHLEQLRAYGVPDRDPRGRVVSVAFLAIMPDLPLPAGTAAWVPVREVRGTLAFDHDRILDDAVERARSQLEFTNLATTFCGSSFTIGDLRHVYEVVWGRPLDPRNFNRKVTGTPGFVAPTGERRVPEVGRPAALYMAGPETTLNPPIMRGHADREGIR